MAGEPEQPTVPAETSNSSTTAPALEADYETSNDGDSAFDRVEDSLRSQSIASSILEYKYENGRRYHAYREGAYALPNDEKEQDRLDLHHHIFRLILGGNLFLAPNKRELHRVLDIGTGTGIWAIDCAEEYPNAEVIGTDLSPIQPTWIPPNARFYIDDAEDDWVWQPDEKFDFIHGRALSGGIQDWVKMYKQAYNHMQPGAWIEMQEYETWILSNEGDMSKTPSLQSWLEKVNEASLKHGKELNEAPRQKQNLIDAGFINVHDEVKKVPIGPWAKDPALKEIGRYQWEQIVAAVEPFTLGYIARFLNWTPDECKVVIAKVTQEIRDRKNHLYVNFHYVYGQKPEE